MAVGTIYTELDIDLTKFVAKQKTLVNQIQKVGKESELALQQPGYPGAAEIRG